MSDPVLNALQRNLENSDPVSQADKIKRIEAAIAEREKAAEKAAAKPEPVPKSVTTTTTTTTSNLAASNKGKK